MTNQSAEANIHTDENIIKPIIFMNAPISQDEEDILGIRPTVEAIDSAIKSGAKMIGVIADYGTGKSSLTDMLCKGRNAIKINMWDSLSKEVTEKEKPAEAISELTKSFLFQLALGESEDTAKYVNRKLSKSYNLLSFSLSSGNKWPLIGIGALLVLLLSSVFSCSLDGIIEIMHDFFPEMSAFWQIAIPFASKYLFAIIFFIVLAIIIFKVKDASVAFSNWKSNNQRTLEINDVFEAYLYVFEKLSGNGKRIVVVEDLDRIDAKDLVVGFLKEIYRFAYLPQDKQNIEGPAFIISVKSEESLKDEANNISHSERINDPIYPKLFDYSVMLRPIHFADYGDIVLRIIGNKKDDLNNLLETNDQIVGDSLPESFHWLLQGHNLTIRQLKDRLNAAVSLLISLKNKSYASQPYINFSSCAAVTYLEAQYPAAYMNLIHKEDKFSDLVRDSYEICRDAEDIRSKKASLLSMLQEDYSDLVKKGKLEEDIVEMLLRRDIDDDFRMYFYSYPKESYIKNADERDITNLLLYPNDYPSDDKLHEKIERIKSAEKTDTILHALEKLRHEGKPFPPIILENESLFLMAYRFDNKLAEESIEEATIWSKESYERNSSHLRKINRYGLSQKEKESMWSDYELWLLMDYGHESKSDQLIQIRKQIILAFSSDITLFKNLFISRGKWSVPMITKEELESVPCVEVCLDLIDPHSIDSDNISYLSECINSVALEGMHLTRATDLYKSAMKALDADELWRPLIDFLSKNAIIDLEMFQYVLSALEALPEDEKESAKEKIGQYLQAIPEETIPDGYAVEIDNAIIDKGLPDWVLRFLYEHQLFAAFLSFLAKENRLGEGIISFTDQANIALVIEACDRIDRYLIPAIRKEIVRQYALLGKKNQLISDYKELYFGTYPIITYSECDELDALDIALELINRSALSADEIESQKGVIDYISNNSSEATCLQCLERLLSTEYEDEYATDDVVNAVIQKLNFVDMEFPLLEDEKKDQAIELIRQFIDLGTVAEADDFMRSNTKCLIPCLERIVAQKEGTYINLISGLDTPTSYTVAWLRENEVYYGLPAKTLERIRLDGQQRNYLIGKVLAESKFEYPFEYVTDETIIGEYSPSSPIWDMMKDHPNLVNHILQEELYKDLNTSEYPEVLQPLYNGKQTVAFVRFLFSAVTDAEKEDYLSNMNEIASANDSIEISKFLAKPENVMLLQDEMRFEHIKMRLWEDENERGKFKGYKANFTAARNRILSLGLKH